MAEPIFVRGVSTFYDRRTLRPPELEGLRNLPQKFHFPYWGRKREKQIPIPTKTRRSAAQTSICAAARTGFFTGGSSTSRVREKQKHPQAQSQNAPECRSDEHLRRGADGLFTGGSSTSRVREKQNTPKRKAKTRQSAAQTGICAAARTGFLREVRPHLGLGKNKNTPKRKAKTRQSAAQTSICAAARTGFLREVRPHLGLGKNKTPPSAKPKRARVPLRRAFAPRRGRALYSGVYVRSRGGAKRSISGAMARFGGGCGSCGEPWGNLRLRSSPCPDRFPRLSFRHAP